MLEELRQRRHNALNYKNILDQMVNTVEEIVMAYREHRSPLFPMIAALSEADRLYLALNQDLEPPGTSIRESGVYRPRSMRSIRRKRKGTAAVRPSPSRTAPPNCCR